MEAQSKRTALSFAGLRGSVGWFQNLRTFEPCIFLWLFFFTFLSSFFFCKRNTYSICWKVRFKKKVFLGVAYGFPDAKGFGGTTTTGQVARKFFNSDVLRTRLVNLCPEQFRPAMERILFNDLILLRLMSCSYVLLPSKIGKDFCSAWPKQESRCPGCSWWVVLWCKPIYWPSLALCTCTLFRGQADHYCVFLK